MHSPLHRVGDSFVRLWFRCFARPSFRRLNNLLVRLGTSGLGIGQADARINGERHLLRQRLGPMDAPVVWDVGANAGDYVELVLAANPRAQIQAFEPHPRTFARLASRFAGINAVHCLPFALGARNETKELWDYSADTSGSEHATFYPKLTAQTQHQAMQPQAVPVRTIDDVAHELGIASIQLLKLDVEGHELAALDGAAGLLARNAIDLVQFEFNIMHLEARVHMNDFAERLPHFTLYRILPHGLLPLPLGFPMLSNLYQVQNILAVRRATSP